jgi:large subunit ribosomal protein L22
MVADKTGKPVEVQAYARYVRFSPRKVRLVADILRGLPADEALLQIKFLRKTAAKPIQKLLESGIANAVHNFKLNREQLWIKGLRVDEGPSSIRYMPRAQGRAFPIKRKTSHIHLILEAREQRRKRRIIPSVLASAPLKAVEEQKQLEGAAQGEEQVREASKPRFRKAKRSGPSKVREQFTALKRRLFSRKTSA